MARVNICFLSLILLILLSLIGCISDSTGEPIDDGNEIGIDVIFKNEDGDILATTIDFTEAELVEDEHGMVLPSFKFREKNQLPEITDAHIGESIHIYFGEELISSPRVMEAIPGNSMMITGEFSEETAKQIVARINNQ